MTEAAGRNLRYKHEKKKCTHTHPVDRQSDLQTYIHTNTRKHTHECKTFRNPQIVIRDTHKEHLLKPLD